MRRTRRPFAAVLCLLTLALPAFAQTSAPTTPRKPALAAPARAAAADPLAANRRMTAINLVNSLADEARSFHDEMLRARVQARAADALWTTEEERARMLFRRAWDAAELGDKELARRFEEDKRRQLERGGSIALQRPPNLRGEVLRLASRRDRALGEELLARLEEERKQQERDAATAAPASPQPGHLDALSMQSSHRLDLARELLQSNETERAMRFAEPALQTVTRDSVFFLTDLREKSPARADPVFAALLARAAADPASDANTVSLLSSYVFTPHTVITIGQDGGASINSSGRTAPPADFPAALRTGFMQMAAQVLLRPPAPADQDRSSGGRASTYFMIARLLPLFEQYLPAGVTLLRTQLTALTPDAPEQVRNAGDELLNVGMKSDAGAGGSDRHQDLLEDNLKKATTDEERDRLYVELAMNAAGRRDPRAREFAEKVSDAETRARLLAYVDYEAATVAVEKKDVDEILRLARRGEMSHLQKVWAYTEAARITAKDNRGRAVEILDEAAEESKRIAPDDADRARAVLAIATPLYELDAGRVWSLMPDLVKTVNSVSDFTGEDGRLAVRFQTKHHASLRTSTIENFNLQPVFASLAKTDLNRAIDLAKGFTGESPRAVATLAVATTALADASKTAAPKPNAPKVDAPKPKKP